MTLSSAELMTLLNLIDSTPSTTATINVATKLEAELKRISPKLHRLWKERLL
jgi:hypothetical protein